MCEMVATEITKDILNKAASKFYRDLQSLGDLPAFLI